MRYAVCPMEQHTRNGRTYFAPRLHTYNASFLTISRNGADGRPDKPWALVVVGDAPYDAAGAAADAQVDFIDEQLDTPLGAKAAVIQNTLNTKYGCGVALTASDTLRTTITKLGLLLHPRFDFAAFRA